MSNVTPSKDAGDASNESIVVQGLSKSYGEFQALKNISFTVRRGEIVGFLGPNGAGKTTTMKILTCFMAPTKGTARVAGFDISDASMDVRKRVGYLPETVPLYPNMLVFDYLRFVAQMRQVPAAKIDPRVRATIKDCGLARFANRPIRELSKGYRQRVGLAQALIHEPEVLILDEPTSGLDPNQIVEIRDLIKAIGREKTVIMSTHILQEVAAVCDRILIIDNGTIVDEGTIADLEGRVREHAHVLITLAPTTASDDTLDPAALAQDLKRLDGIEGVKTLDHDNPNTARFQLRVSDDTNARRAVSGFARKEGLDLLEIHRERLSLEDIFRALTGAGRKAAEFKKHTKKTKEG